MNNPVFPRIVCVGANIESEAVLRALIQSHVAIVGLVTLPRREEIRGSDYRDLTGLADENDITLLITEDINSDITKVELRSLDPDYIFILGWSQLLDSELINSVRQCVIGSHPSNLPYGAGRAPVPWTILENLHESAVTFFEITPEVDAGKILLQKKFTITERENSNNLYKIVSDVLAKGFVDICRLISDGELYGKYQPDQGRTVRARRVFEDGLIDFNRTGDEIDCLIRAVTSPFPGAFTYCRGSLLTVWKSTRAENNYHKGVPGQILKKSDKGLLVQCADEPLWLSDFTIAGSTIDNSHFRLGDKLGISPAVEIYRLTQRIEQIERLLKIDGTDCK